MIFAGITGYVVACSWFFYEELFCDSSSFDLTFELVKKKDVFFNNNPAYMLWLSMVIIQPVIWFILLIPTTFIISKLSKELASGREVILSFIALLILFGGYVIITDHTFKVYLTPPNSKLANHINKLPRFTQAGQIIGLYYLFGAILISKVSMKKVQDKCYDILSYKRMKGYLDAIINFTGVILSLAVISAILLNKVVDDKSIYPPEFVICLGLFNSGLILIIYLPAHFTLLYYGKQILENKSSINDAKNENEFLFKYEEISKTLNLSLGITQSAKTAMVILSPLISSLIPDILNVFQK